MLKVGPALMEHAEQLERERGIPKDVVISSLQEAMVAAYKRYAKLPDAEGIICKLIERTGEIGVFQQLEIVKEVKLPDPDEDVQDADENDNTGEAPLAEGAAPAEPQYDEAGNLIEPDPATEQAEVQEEEEPEIQLAQISLHDARKIKPDVEIGEILEIEVTPSEFGRIAAQAAKQVIMQRIREAEKGLIQREFEDKQGSVMTAIVQRIEGNNVIVSIGKTEAVLPSRQQLPGEYYRVGNKLRVYVLELRESGRVPQIIVSQSHEAMVREVFELEVPEIEDGIVELKAISREAGYRTKVAVHSSDPDVDPQGACIGSRGSRIQAIVNELKNEKIDIIKWSEDPAQFIAAALAPAKKPEVHVAPDEDFKRALVVVPDDQLSLAIGREGQNVRLAAKLTGYKLDIRSRSQYQHDLAIAQEEAARRQAEALNVEATEVEDEATQDETGEIVEVAEATNTSETDTAETADTPEEKASA
ncbi:MAG: transcription termination factor NusA [Vampirovibrionales bacterium]|nr:transcription termination factor NusA [Vampirovibrionales bacterium]